MKTIEQLEQEAKDAREILIRMISGQNRVMCSEDFANAMILASVKMMAYQLAHEKRKTTIDSEEFFNLMQAYRQVPLGDLSARFKYDAVIDYINNYTRLNGVSA